MKTGVIIEFVDGGLQRFEGESFVRDVERAREPGLSGRVLIDAVFTNGWGARPKHMTVMRDGKVLEVVPY
jgi:hypothetical protein